jgi:hypothetical protein
MNHRVVEIKTNCAAISLDFQIEAAGSRRVGEIMVALFF